MSWPVIYMTAVGIIYGIGVWFARDRRWRTHRALMWCGFSLDLALTLYLEVARGVIEKSLGISRSPFTGNGYLLTVHIMFAVSLLVFYVLTLRRGLRGTRQTRFQEYSKAREINKHRKLGYAALSLYGLSYITAPGWLVEMLINQLR